MPPTADAGTATEIAGSHPAVLSPTPAVPVTTACGAPDRSPAAVPAGRLVPVAVMVPVVVMGPTVYPTSVTGMISAGVAVPVVQLLAEAVAIQEAVSRARASATTTEAAAARPPAYSMKTRVPPVRPSRLTRRPVSARSPRRP